MSLCIRRKWMQRAVLITASPQFVQHQGWGSEQFHSHVFAKVKTGWRSVSWKCHLSPPSSHSRAIQQHQFKQWTACTNPIAIQQQTWEMSMCMAGTLKIRQWLGLTSRDPKGFYLRSTYLAGSSLMVMALKQEGMWLSPVWCSLMNFALKSSPANHVRLLEGAESSFQFWIFINFF